MLVDRWRKELVEGLDWLPNGQPNFIGKDAYSSLATHLPNALRRQVEGTDEQGCFKTRTVWVRGEGDEALRIALIAEIARIEKHWKLV